MQKRIVLIVLDNVVVGELVCQILLNKDKGANTHRTILALWAILILYKYGKLGFIN
jgi:phosphopentomutase